MVSAGSILMHPCKGKCCWSPGSVPLSVPFLCLQRRLREAVQLLEDYKHGTLRPGVTNEQVTLLEVGWGNGGREGRWQIRYPCPAARTASLPPRIHFYCCYISCGLVGFGGDTQGPPVSCSGGKYGGC